MISSFTMRVLIAEDEALFAELIQRNLHPALEKFKIVHTLRDAMLEAETGEWDMILLDLRLLDSDWKASMDMIRALKKAARAAVVVVSGMPIPGLREQCIAAGADGFCDKNVAITTNALRIAVIAASIHVPDGKRSTQLMQKVRILEELVKAA